MAYRRTPFVPGEWYHCYNRGVDKRTVFETVPDYERFLEALYLSNNIETSQRGTFYRLPHADVMHLERQEPIVAIGAYCLMPNHFHLLIKEIVEGGITKFMHRVGTSYTMYFNVKRERVGNLFVKPFRSKHIADDIYFKRVAQYIHLNPVEIFEPQWKKGVVDNTAAIEEKLKKYPYSSLPDYHGSKRLENVILDREAVKLLKEDMPPINELIPDMSTYYAELDV